CGETRRLLWLTDWPADGAGEVSQEPRNRTAAVVCYCDGVRRSRPLEARADGRALPLGGPKQRALLAMLLLHANEPVSRDRLTDGLWGEHPPATAAHTLDGYVSRLRKLLGGDRLTRQAPGYRLRVEPGELDLELFGQ